MSPMWRKLFGILWMNRAYPYVAPGVDVDETFPNFLAPFLSQFSEYLRVLPCGVFSRSATELAGNCDDVR